MKIKKKSAVAVISLAGRIDDVTSAAMLSAFRKVKWRANKIGALLIKVSSEGGSLGVAQSVCELLESLREEQGLKIVCVVENVALSAAFYLLFVADAIVATPAANLGSLGATISTYDTSSLQEKIGAYAHIVKSSPLKGEVTSAEGFAALQSLVDDAHNQFSEWIAVRRGLQKLPPILADGRIITGRQAVHAKVVDHQGGVVKALQVAAEFMEMKDLNIITIELDARKPSLPWAILEYIPLAGYIRNMLSNIL